MYGFNPSPMVTPSLTTGWTARVISLRTQLDSMSRDGSVATRVHLQNELTAALADIDRDAADPGNAPHVAFLERTKADLTALRRQLNAPRRPVKSQPAVTPTQRRRQLFAELERLEGQHPTQAVKVEMLKIRAKLVELLQLSLEERDARDRGHFR